MMSRAHRQNLARRTGSVFRTQLVVLLCLVTVFGAACGGGGAGSGRSTAGGPEATLRSQSGAEVTKSAQRYWDEGVAAFERAEAAGFQGPDCEEALESFQDAEEAQPGFGEAVYMQGLVQERCVSPQVARGLYERALQVNPALCGARAALGVLQLDARDWAGAEATFQTAISNDPLCTEAYANLAIVQRRKVASDPEALKNLRRALAINAQYLPAFNEMALFYLDAAQRNRKKLDLAEVVCSQAQKIDSNYAPIYNTWGLIDLRRDKIIEASAKFQKAFQLDPTMFEAYMNFGQITLGFRGYSDAKIAFERALTLVPDSFEAQVGLGVALRGLEDNASAVASYQKAMALRPERAEPYYNLGVLYQDFQDGTAADMDQAERYFRDFLEKAKGEPRFVEAIQDVTRKCEPKRRRRRGKTAKCIAGRLQNIANYRQALREMQEIEALQRESEAAEAAMQEEAAPAPSAGEDVGNISGSGGGLEMDPYGAE